MTIDHLLQLIDERGVVAVATLIREFHVPDILMHGLDITNWQVDYTNGAILFYQVKPVSSTTRRIGGLLHGGGGVASVFTHQSAATNLQPVVPFEPIDAPCILAVHAPESHRATWQALVNEMQTPERPIRLVLYQE